MQKGLNSSDQIDSFLDSLPVHLRTTFGGESSCVELDCGTDEFFLCDLGSGSRVFAGDYLAKPENERGKIFNVFMSHLHWDHIMGFPFFTPAYLPGHKIRIFGCHNALEETFRRQHCSPNFPVDFDALSADIEFSYLAPDETVQIGPLKVTPTLQLHEGDSYGYRFEVDGRVVVYSTDAEHKVEDQQGMQKFTEFFKDADLVIFDAMYSLIEAVTLKEDWGHSSNLTGVELCLRANAKKLCLFHHDPIHSDMEILNNLQEAKGFKKLLNKEHELEIFAAYDGLEISVSTSG